MHITQQISENLHLGKIAINPTVGRHNGILFLGRLNIWALFSAELLPQNTEFYSHNLYMLQQAEKRSADTLHFDKESFS